MKFISRVHVYLFILLQVCHQQAHCGLTEIFQGFADMHTPTVTSTGTQSADAFPSDFPTDFPSDIPPVDKTSDSAVVNSGIESQNKMANEVALASKQTQTQKTARDMPSNSFPLELPLDEHIFIEPQVTSVQFDPLVQPADTHVFVQPKDTSSVHPDTSVQPFQFFQPNFPIGKPFINLETGKVNIFDPSKIWLADPVDATHTVDTLAPPQDKPATNTVGTNGAMETHHSDSMINVPVEHVGPSSNFIQAVHSQHVDVLPDFTPTKNVNLVGSINTKPIEHAVERRVKTATDKSADFIPNVHSQHIDVLPDFTATGNVHLGGSIDTQSFEHAVEKGVETAAEKSVGFTADVQSHIVGVAANSTFIPAPIEHVPDFAFDTTAIERAAEKALESTFDTHTHTEMKPIVNGQDVKPHVEVIAQTTVKPKSADTKRHTKWYERIRGNRRRVQKTTTTEKPIAVSKALQDLLNKSLNSFGKNRGLTRILRRNQRRERARRRKERDQRRAEASAKSNNKDQKKKGSNTIAKMMIPGRANPFVGKTNIGRPWNRACTRRRLRLGLCKKEW